MLSVSPASNPLMSPLYVNAAGQTARPAASASPPAGSTSPAQMRRFYSADNINFNGVPGDGRGMTIAVVDAYDLSTVWSDLQAFDSYYGLPNPASFQVLNQNGQASPLPSADAPGGWGIESALDVEWAHSMAPLANIVLVEANSSFTSDLFNAVQTAANLPNVVAVSMSFGTGEVSNESIWDSYFSTPSNHGGVTFLAATGDQGTPGTYPAFSPKVVAVGGTSITYASDGTYSTETAWSGTGGGTSVYEAKPAYQNGVQNSTFRTIPDVSLDAAPSTGVAIYDSYDLGASTPWGKYGGTSLATPMFSGLVAIADQGRVSVGQSRLDGATQVLPALYSMGATNYHDVVGGTSLNGATAVAGYDLATGIGSPIANRLVNQLASAPSAPPQVSGTSGNDNFALTLDPNQLYVDWSNGTSSGQVAVVDLNGLMVNGGGGNDTITLNYANGNPLPNLLKVNGNFTLTGLQGTNPLAGKAIDLNQSKVFIDYTGGPDPVSTVRQYIVNGYNGGLWNGQPTASTGVITSSAAAQNASYAIGWADSADGSGVNSTANSIELKYTLMGDANLNGTVDIFDLNALLPHFNGAGGWTSGDFNYSSNVDIFDLNALLPNFNVSMAPQVAPATTSSAVTAATSTQTSAPAPTSAATSSKSNPTGLYALSTLSDDASTLVDWIKSHLKKTAKGR